MKKIVLTIGVSILGLFITGCAHTPKLTEKGRAVEIVSKNSIKENCQVLDVISARKNSEQGAASGAITEIRNNAAIIGANTVSVISSSSNEYGVVTVTAEVLICK